MSNSYHPAPTGEFHPQPPRSQPLTTQGHQPGLKTSPADHAPTFSAQTLPPGTAPASRTFKPDASSEVPGQASNPDATTSSDPLDFPGATSGDVHTGLGHPGSGQTSAELRHDGRGQGSSKKEERSGPVGSGAERGSGLSGDGGKNAEFEKLARDRPIGEHGPLSARARDGGDAETLEGAEVRESERAV